MAGSRVIKVLLVLAVLAFPTAYAVGAVTSDPDPVPSRAPLVLPTEPAPRSTEPTARPSTRSPAPPSSEPSRSRPACDDDPDDDGDGVVVVRPCPEDIGDDEDDDERGDDDGTDD